MIATPNENKSINIKKTKVYNIYSKYDRLAKDAVFLLAPTKGGKTLTGKTVKNIKIPHFNHNDFCSDAKIKSGYWKGKRVSQIVNHLLSK